MSGSSSTMRMERCPDIWPLDSADAEKRKQLFLRDRPPRRFREVSHRKRLRQEINVLDVDRLPELLLGIARHEQHLQVRTALTRLAHHRWAIHARHDDIAYEEVDRLVLRDDLQ